MEQPARPRLAVTDDNDHPSEAPARGTGSVSVPWTTTDAEYGDTSAQIWKLYGFESERYDKALVEGWLNNTSAMLIFTGLFSSIVSSFLVETYKILQPDSGSQTVTLLSQLVSQSNRTGSPALSGPASLSPKIPSSAVRINILMFLSLFLSVSSALASILIQQWAREYLQYSQPSAAPHRRGRVRAYLFLGLRQFQMGSLVYGVPVFLHVSVFLFFWALSDFLHTVNSTVGTVARFCVVALVAIYIALSACPLIFTNSPYRTALTTPIRACAVLFQSALFYAGRVPFRTYGPYPGWRGTRTRRPINAGRAVVLSKKANSDTITPKLDSSVLHWLLQELDERGMDAFLEGLPGYVTSPLADARRLVKGLSADKILLRIREHFTTCVTSSELSPPACISRTRVCISSLHLLSGSMDTSSEQGGLDSVYTESILDHLQSLCNIKDQEVSLRAACVRSLVLQGFWTPFTPSTYGNIPTEPFPDYLVPVYKFLLPRIELPSFQWESLGGTRMGSLQVPQLDNQVNQAFWTRVLHDGPLINLSILANIVISQVQEGGVDFTMCWDTFDVLVESCGSSTIRASDLARLRFDGVRTKTRNLISSRERGHDAVLVRLLGIMDALVRRLRFAAVFQHQPQPLVKLTGDLENAPLRNPELLDVFAKCLPAFKRANPANRFQDQLERIILDDDLWDSLRANLRVSMDSDRPISHKLRSLEACLDVLDEAFPVLENSQDEDWHVSEFGLMMVQMEKFIELTRRMYPDALSGQSALDFRIAVYDAHCCNALLSRHLAESAGGERAVLRSWSAVALAKVAFVLNIGEKSDSMERTNSGRGSDGKYWPSYVGGEELHIPPERFHHLRSEIADDGHLLNFCTLGGRIVSAILEESSPINVQRPRELLARITERVCAGRQSLSSSEARNKLQRLRDQTHTALVQPTPSRDKEKSDFLVALSDMMQEIRRSDLPDDRDDLELPVHGERAAGGGSVHIPRFWSPRPPQERLDSPELRLRQAYVPSRTYTPTQSFSPSRPPRPFPPPRPFSSPQPFPPPRQQPGRQPPLRLTPPPAGPRPPRRKGRNPRAETPIPRQHY